MSLQAINRFVLAVMVGTASTAPAPAIANDGWRAFAESRLSCERAVREAEEARRREPEAEIVMLDEWFQDRDMGTPEDIRAYAARASYGRKFLHDLEQMSSDALARAIEHVSEPADFECDTPDGIALISRDEAKRGIRRIRQALDLGYALPPDHPGHIPRPSHGAMVHGADLIGRYRVVAPVY